MHSPLHPLHGPYAGLENPPNLPHKVADVLARLRSVTSMVVESFSALTDTTTAINRDCQYLLDVMEHYLPEHFETRRESLMFEALCLAAKVYVKCISQGIKFSEGFPKVELQNLQDILSTLSRSAWDTVPGVFLFIHLVAQPAARLIPDSNAYFSASQQRLVAPLALVMYSDTVLSLEIFILVQRYIRVAESTRARSSGASLCH
jgi:hypothetical protein